MKSIDSHWFYRGFRKRLGECLPAEQAERVRNDAEERYQQILLSNPYMEKHKGAMVLPAVALYQSLESNGEDAEKLLNEYGESMGKRFARIINRITKLPGVDRLIWNRVENLTEKMSSEEKGYRRRLVSDPPDMYGVDILSCPYHELAKEAGCEKAVLCICHMDKEYSKGFHHIRYDRNSAVSEGAECCEYRLRFDPEKE